jgi:hypothetical protein
MNQRSICLFLALNGLSAMTVSNELTAVLGADAIADSIVTKCPPQRQFTFILVDPPPRGTSDDPYWSSSSWCPWALSILFSSEASSSHLHSNYYSPLTLNAITWFCGEASSLGSSHSHPYSKKGACHSLNWTLAPAPVHLTSRLAVHYHPRRVMILSFYTPWEDLAWRKRTTPWKSEAYHPRPKRDDNRWMESIRISFTRRTSKKQYI